MLRAMVLGGLVLAMMSGTVSSASSTVESIDPTLKSASELRTAGKLPESLALLQKLSTELQAILPPDSDAGETLAVAVEESRSFSDVSRQQNRLFWGLQETRAAIGFKPLLEAPLPAGFPPPGDVGKIIVKEYPPYRAARTPMGGKVNDNGAFGKLFRHISTHEVKMTAPVEMVYKNDDAPLSMAFLYERPDLGNSGQDGEVEVIDLPAVIVLSIGVRGNYSDEKRQQALTRLHNWLDQHKAEYDIAGPVRVMGYNSPFVLPILRFSEVQIPIRRK